MATAGQRRWARYATPSPRLRTGNCSPCEQRWPGKQACALGRGYITFIGCQVTVQFLPEILGAELQFHRDVLQELLRKAGRVLPRPDEAKRGYLAAIDHALDGWLASY